MLSRREGATMRCVLMICVLAQAAVAAPHKSASPQKEAAEQAARGDAWTLAGRCDVAIKAYKAALAADESNAVVKVRLAHCLAKTGAREEAEAMLKPLVDAPPPAGPLALTALGDLLAQAGEHAR